MPIQRVLIVDDDPLSREFLTEAVIDLGYRADGATSGEQALERSRERSYDLVLCELRMPEMDGAEFIKALSGEFPGLPAVLITTHGTVEAAGNAMKHGAVDFLQKPWSPETLELVIERVDRTLRLERENEYLRGEVQGRTGFEVIARSRPMLETLRTASRIARSKGTVLVTGESGTGKERVAQFIHRSSPRVEGPFIRVNCAALPEQVLESELFGHERGAFTGARKAREGRFELADKGTLLLDEIGELSPALQAKLLRVLEEEEFERVGGTHTLHVDVRVIATTNRKLPEEVAAGRFREDLFYRLHVLPLEMSPLRDRREDVMPLAEHFADMYARQNGHPVPAFSAEARQRLEDWSWPGNVRELENIVQRAVALLQGATIDAEDLAFGPRSAEPTAQGLHLVRDGHAPLEDFAHMMRDHKLADIERFAILATIDSSGGNKTEAARRLGVTARTLSNKMKLWRQMGYVA